MVWETPEEQSGFIKSADSSSHLDSPCDQNYEDWGCGLDDQDPGYWEGLLGGPDDDAIESFYCQEASSDNCTEIDDSGSPEDTGSTDRQRVDDNLDGNSITPEPDGNISDQTIVPIRFYDESRNTCTGLDFEDWQKAFRDLPLFSEWYALSSQLTAPFRVIDFRYEITGQFDPQQDLIDLGRPHDDEQDGSVFRLLGWEETKEAAIARAAESIGRTKPIFRDFPMYPQRTLQLRDRLWMGFSF